MGTRAWNFDAEHHVEVACEDGRWIYGENVELPSDVHRFLSQHFTDYAEITIKFTVSGSESSGSWDEPPYREEERVVFAAEVWDGKDKATTRKFDQNCVDWLECEFQQQIDMLNVEYAEAF